MKNGCVLWNEGWQFRKRAASEWKTVTLPHDAMLCETRDPKCKNGQNSGYFPGGAYIYEKTFEVLEDWKGKYVAVHFEGVYHRSKVFLNGVLLGSHANGYTPFELELDDLHGGENTLRVELDTTDEPNSRWYSGAGIYRPVWLVVKEKDHIRDLRIDTVSYEPPTIRVSCDHEDVGVTIFDGDTVLWTGSCGTITLEGAQLWDEHNPKLYRCVVKTATDLVEQRFGIRKLEWITGKGLLLNGNVIKLRGGCIHHDNGLLGACAFRDAEYRKIRILKEAGFNAIRSAHNLCSESLLDACDELGMYVMDEAFDQWYMPKTKFDYARDFEENFRADLASMVSRDRNHPSVILYSIGNEISETAQERGIALTGEMVELLRSLDATRPITCGINLFLNGLISKGIGIYSEDGESMADKATSDDDRMSKLSGSALYNAIMEHLSTIKNIVSLAPFADKATKDAFAKLDICGYNYGTARYKKDSRKYPNRLIVGSETYIPGLYDVWKQVEQQPNLIGDFLWAIWDYLGEAGLGTWRYGEGGFKKPYPMLAVGCGIFSITGHPDPQLYYIQTAYGKKDILKIAVRPVDHSDEKCARSPWRMTDAIESWDWYGCEGKTAMVEVYTTGHKVSLFLNGNAIATKKATKGICRFKLPWKPGVLQAVAYDAHGARCGESILRSPDGEKYLKVTADRTELRADGQSLAYLDIEVVDKNGTRFTKDDTVIRVEAENIRLQALGSDRVSNPESYLQNHCTTHFGRAQAILRAGTQPGTATVRICCDGMESNEIYLQLVPAER